MSTAFLLLSNLMRKQPMKPTQSPNAPRVPRVATKLSKEEKAFSDFFIGMTDDYFAHRSPLTGSPLNTKGATV